MGYIKPMSLEKTHQADIGMTLETGGVHGAAATFRGRDQGLVTFFSLKSGGLTRENCG